MRMKDVIISVTGVQQGVNGPDAMELVTAGQYGQDEKETLLTWQESELTGMEGTKTSLCVQPRSVVLSREGTLNTRMEFEEGRKRYFLYEAPFGSATMGLNTRRIVNRLGAHGGEIEIDYSVDMDDTIVGRNRFFIRVQEPYQRCHISQLSDPYEASLVQREVANPKGLTEGLQTALLAK